MVTRLLFVFILFLLCEINCGKNSASSGSSSGFLSDCGPSITMPAMIRKKHLKKLTFTTLCKKGGFMAKKIKYNYYQMKQLAKDPCIDFKNKKTILFVGGYLESSNFGLAVAMGTHYKDQSFNVIIADTAEFTTMEYPLAARHLKAVGVHIAKMLTDLTSHGLNPKNLTVLGLSLGGQTMNYIGKNYKNHTGVKIDHLVALDPAGPCFRNLGPEDRLDKSDADFVEVINTNIDGFGFGPPIGHVNFYINGGEYQPADFMFWFPCDIICSHVKVIMYWIAAITNPETFIGIKCNSVQQARDKDCYRNNPMVTNIMGFDTDRNKPGIYFIATTNKYPYSMGLDGTKKSHNYINAQIDMLGKNEMMVY